MQNTNSENESQDISNDNSEGLMNIDDVLDDDQPNTYTDFVFDVKLDNYIPTINWSSQERDKYFQDKKNKHLIIETELSQIDYNVYIYIFMLESFGNNCA